MALIRVEKFEDFAKLAEQNATASTHVLVTDGASYAWLVPIVTSQHRHYILLEAVSEEDVKRAIEWARGKNIKIVHGSVELRTC